MPYPNDKLNVEVKSISASPVFIQSVREYASKERVSFSKAIVTLAKIGLSHEDPKQVKDRRFRAQMREEVMKQYRADNVEQFRNSDIVPPSRSERPSFDSRLAEHANAEGFMGKVINDLPGGHGESAMLTDDEDDSISLGSKEEFEGVYG